MTGVSIGTSTCCGALVSIAGPDGAAVGLVMFVGTTGGFVDSRLLSEDGLYTILIDPQGQGDGVDDLDLVRRARRCRPRPSPGRRAGAGHHDRTWAEWCGDVLRCCRCPRQPAPDWIHALWILRVLRSPRHCPRSDRPRARSVGVRRHEWRLPRCCNPAVDGRLHDHCRPAGPRHGLADPRMLYDVPADATATDDARRIRRHGCSTRCPVRTCRSPSRPPLANESASGRQHRACHTSTRRSASRAGTHSAHRPRSDLWAAHSSIPRRSQSPAHTPSSSTRKPRAITGTLTITIYDVPADTTAPITPNGPAHYSRCPSRDRTAPPRSRGRPASVSASGSRRRACPSLR